LILNDLSSLMLINHIQITYRKHYNTWRRTRFTRTNIF